MIFDQFVRVSLQEKLAITICINKIDRLVLELKLPPQVSYKD
jgi:U5 small nuclear ribonucleoprotein component